MRKVCLVFLINESFDCLTSFEQAYREIGCEVESIGLPNVWISDLNRKYVRDLKALIEKKKSQRNFLVFSPQSTELFLKDADLTLVYSAYRSWFNPKKMRVIPHLWTPVRSPKSNEHLRWTTKPPLRIGFMGRFHTSSRLARIVSKLPKQVKQCILQGRYLRYPKAIGLLNELGVSPTAAGAFARIEAINSLLSSRLNCKQGDFDIIEKKDFAGAEQELSEYRNHLERCTYILCPRRIENYSFRIYEALSSGRIPIIVDTDIVLPKEINWDRVSLKVPYESLDKLADMVFHDYEARSGVEFMARQTEALRQWLNFKRCGGSEIRE